MREWTVFRCPQCACLSCTPSISESDTFLTRCAECKHVLSVPRAHRSIRCSKCGDSLAYFETLGATTVKCPHCQTENILDSSSDLEIMPSSQTPTPSSGECVPSAPIGPVVATIQHSINFPTTQSGLSSEIAKLSTLPRPALEKLSTALFMYSWYCATPLRSLLNTKGFKEGSDEHTWRFWNCVFEFIYLFQHLTNRSAFRQLGFNKKGDLQEALIDESAKLVILVACPGAPEDFKDRMAKRFYSASWRAEQNYSECEEVFLSPREDVCASDRMAGGRDDKGRFKVKCKSMFARLFEEIQVIISGEAPLYWYDMDYDMRLFQRVCDCLKATDLNLLVVNAAQEMP